MDKNNKEEIDRLVETSTKRFTNRFKELIEILKEIIPSTELIELLSKPHIINPPLRDTSGGVPTPQFYKSFEWYIVLPLNPGSNYGPFYRVDGESIWPKNSDGKTYNSESKFYYTLEEPADKKDAERMCAMSPDNSREYVYELWFDAGTIGSEKKAELFLGPIYKKKEKKNEKDTGYQFNANNPAADIVRRLISNGKIRRKKLKLHTENNKYNWEFYKETKDITKSQITTHILGKIIP